MKLPKNKFKILYKKRLPCPKETQYWQDQRMPQGGGSFLISAYHELLADFRLISNFLILPPNPRPSDPPKAKSFFTGQTEG